MTDIPRVAAAVGDTFILLVPDDSEGDYISQWQGNLQSHFSGQKMTPVHVTCQRFSSPPRAVIDTLISDLHACLINYEPMSITGCHLQVIHSPFHQTNLLKCKIRLTESLIELGTHIETILQANDLVGHYPTSISDCVTALKDIRPNLAADDVINLMPPTYLFTGCALMVTVATGSDQFDRIAQIKFV